MDLTVAAAQISFPACKSTAPPIVGLASELRVSSWRRHHRRGTLGEPPPIPDPARVSPKSIVAEGRRRPRAVDPNLIEWPRSLHTPSGAAPANGWVRPIGPSHRALPRACAEARPVCAGSAQIWQIRPDAIFFCY
jgi:hypothetical protein